MTNLWNLKLSQIYQQFNSREKGLDESTVILATRKFGRNLPLNLSAPNPIKIFFRQFKNILIIILIFISFFSFFTNETLNGVIILIMLLINAIIGFLQELKAEKSLEKLRGLISFRSRVIRAGIEVEIDSKDLLPGDIVHLNMGNLVPADIRLIKTNNFTVNESSLTGESLPVEKVANTEGVASAIPQHINNGIFTGTAVVSGSALGIVVATGQNTILYNTVSLTKDSKETTNFEKVIKELSNTLLIFVIFLTVFVFVSNALMQRDLVESFMLGVTVALGITPEIMPIIISIAVSSASFRLAKYGVLIRRLNALEDLGNVDVICTDKTGTVTNGVLELSEYLDLASKPQDQIIYNALLCNAYNPQTNDQLFLNPIDAEIWNHKLRSEFSTQLSKTKILYTRDFNFESRLMGVIAEDAKTNKKMAIIKGASENIVAMCNSENLSAKQKSQIKTQVTQFENKGNRVIAVAKIELEASDSEHILPHSGYTFLGFILFKDNPKDSFDETIAELTTLNVDLKIITGDSPVVSRVVCQQAGLNIAESQIITGIELVKLDTQALALAVESHKIFARVSPEQKYLIIKALKANGHVVGYIGDGINDIGAIRIADVGLSVDSANDVTKDASDIVLLKKDLSVLAKGIIEGRKTFENTIKFILNTMSSSFGNVLTIGIFSLFLKFMPFLPSQVLLIDSLSDIQHLTISTDTVDQKQLQKPLNFNIKFLIKFMLYFGAIGTLVDMLHVYIFQFLFTSADIFRTIWFIESILTELLATFIIRTNGPFYKSLPSKPLIITSLVAIFLGIGITFSTLGHEIFGFVNIDFPAFFIVALLVLLYLVILEGAKLIFYQKLIRQNAKIINK